MSNRRDNILQEAARLFRTNGYAQTTVREIAEAVDMQSGSLFYHFASKEDILVEIMGDGINLLISKLEESLKSAVTPREKLLALLTVHLTAVLEEAPDAMGLYLYEWRSLSADARDKLTQQRDSYEKHVNDLLSEIAVAGLISPDVKLFRLFLLGALNWTAEWFDSGGQLSAREIAGRFLQFITFSNENIRSSR